MPTQLTIALSLVCTLVAAYFWKSRPQKRSAALFPLGISAVLGSSVAKDSNVWWSMALSVLAIALFLTALWMQKSEPKN
ncbi:hypothetical protein [Gemmatimonas phototrophica]|uniref:Uncharacterized protein n=1 Tax=Gemmatimonas phototrophica TaxID=1379270 RepID=A0A143BI89_9BACT|nr:hypothetical protein [Gemmatimonas phototrophica]AMW04718.1 hypothetical protein GEMMAAP_07430 [Gemmatimonas phototrophica]